MFRLEIPTYFNPLLHYAPKWSDLLYKSCSITGLRIKVNLGNDTYPKLGIVTQPAFICSKLTIATLEQDVKNVQS